MPITACKGTVDILPAETARWRQVEAAAHLIAQRFGYQEIRTPAFEATELFTGALVDDTDVVDREFYTFKDRSGRSITLRPEFTLPTLRAAIEHGLLGNGMFKGYYLGEVWRHDRPQGPRLSDTHHFGVEAVGATTPAMDAEVVDAALAFFAEAGLRDVRVEVNTIGCKRCRPAYQTVLRDFFAGKDDVLCPDCERRKDRNALRILDCRREVCVKVSNTAPTVFGHLCADCKTHFQTFKDYLALMGHTVHGSMRLVYGTGYYSRTMFQIVSPLLGGEAPLCVGGRYDDLVAGLGGPAAPGVGFSVGLERTLQALAREEHSAPKERVDVFFVGSGDEAERIMAKTMHQMRKRGFRVERDYTSRSLKNQQRTCERFAPVLVVSLGEEDARVTTVQVQDVARGSQESVHINRLVEALDYKLRREQRETRERAPERLRGRTEGSDELGRRSRRDRGRDREPLGAQGSADEAQAVREPEEQEREGRAGLASEGRRERGRDRFRGRERERGTGDARGGARAEGSDEGGDGARFAEWAAAYAEAARQQASTRVPRRVVFSSLALGQPDAHLAAAEVWACVQEGLLAKTQGLEQPWPAHPLTPHLELPPRRELPTVSGVEPSGRSWLDDGSSSSDDETLEDAVDQDVTVGGFEGDGEEPHREPQVNASLDDDDDGDDGDDDGDDLDESGASGTGRSGSGDKKRRGSRRGGRRHGRRRPRSSKG